MTLSVPTDSQLPRELKLLFLHGYTRSGPHFSIKTKSLQKALHKAFPAAPHADAHPSYPGGMVCTFLTAPWRIRDVEDSRNSPALRQDLNQKDYGPQNDDINPLVTGTPTASDLIWTGTSPSIYSDASDEEAESYAWWSKDARTGEYAGLSDTLTFVADFMRKNGPFHGVVGFSQGACLAGILASLLPTSQDERQQRAHSLAERLGLGEHLKSDGKSEQLPHDTRRQVRKAAMTEAVRVSHFSLPWPPAFDDSQALPPLLFVVSYGGFRADDVLHDPNTKLLESSGRYNALYKPPILTPLLHHIGLLDVVIDEKRSMGLVHTCAVGTSQAIVGQEDTVLSSLSRKQDEADMEEAQRRVVRFQGGHFVPQGKKDIEIVVHFVKGQLEQLFPDACKPQLAEKL